MTIATSSSTSEPGQTTSDGLRARTLAAAVERAGRLNWNDWRTGVAGDLVYAQRRALAGDNGATAHPVGATAIRRFQRPVALSGPARRSAAASAAQRYPIGIPRRVDGRMTPEPIGSHSDSDLS